MMVLWSVTLKIGALTKLGLFFPVVCFICVFDQTLSRAAVPRQTRSMQLHFQQNGIRIKYLRFHSIVMKGNLLQVAVIYPYEETSVAVTSSQFSCRY